MCRTPGVRTALSFSGRLLYGLAALALLAAPAAAGSVRESAGSFAAEGKKITVEHFAPPAGGKHPAVVLLHGCEGLGDFGPLYRCQARTLAGEGYVVLLVHYFDRTGTTRTAPGKIKEEHFRAWLDTIRGAVRYAAGLPGVDRERVALLGFSLGAYLSLAAAAPADLPIAAVIDLFGGLPKKLHKSVKSLPPTLIVHGDADRTVPVAEAHALEGLFKSKKLTCEVMIYKGQDHLFKTAPFGPEVDHARQLVLDFLRRYLKGPPRAGAGK